MTVKSRQSFHEEFGSAAVQWKQTTCERSNRPPLSKQKLQRGRFPNDCVDMFWRQIKDKHPGQGEVKESLLLTFNPKGGSLGRLPEAGEGVELQVGGQGLDQANGHGAFTLAQRSGRYTAFTKKHNFLNGIFGVIGVICCRGAEAGPCFTYICPVWGNLGEQGTHKNSVSS